MGNDTLKIKKRFYVLYFIIAFTSFNVLAQTNKKKQYTKPALLSFLDSIGKLDPKTLTKKVTQYSDSLFNQPQIKARIVSKANMQNIKYHDREKIDRIDNKFVANIFGKLALKMTDTSNQYNIKFFHFGKQKNKYDEFAIGVLYPQNGYKIYFFKNNTVVGQHNYDSIHGEYGPYDIKYFTDSDQKTVIYYSTSYDGGTGVTWSNNYFYKYMNNTIIPVLNEIKESNLSAYWGARGFGLTTKIIKTNPLTIKMDYKQNLPDNLNNEVPIIKGTTTIKYIWNNKLKKLTGNYNVKQLNKNQLFTYYTRRNTDILFINTHYKQLKKLLLGKQKALALNYLNNIKNQQKLKH